VKIALIRFALCALLPSVDGMPGLAPADAERFARQCLSEATWIYRLGLIGGSLMFVVTPILTIRTPLPAFWLSADALDRHAALVAAHPWYVVRQAIFLTKMSAGMAWVRDPRLRNTLALPPLAGEPGTWRTT
jgi:hypothetical protein